MAEPTPFVDVFKFVAVRPPDKPDPTKISRNFLRDARPLDGTVVAPLIKNPSNAAITLRFVQEKANKLNISSDDPVGNDHADLMRLWSFLRNAKPSTENTLAALIKSFLGQTPENFLKKASDTNVADNLWDRLYICYLLNLAGSVNMSDLLGGLRTLGVLEALKSADITSLTDLNSLLSVTVIIPTQVADWLKPKPDPTVPVVSPASATLTKEKAKSYTALIRDFVLTHESIGQVQKLPVTNKVVSQTKVVQGTGAKSASIRKKQQVSRNVIYANTQALNKLPDFVKTILQRGAGNGPLTSRRQSEYAFL
jgi:hypothetical protein